MTTTTSSRYLAEPEMRVDDASSNDSDKSNQTHKTSGHIHPSTSTCQNSDTVEFTSFDILTPEATPEKSSSKRSLSDKMASRVTQFDGRPLDIGDWSPAPSELGLRKTVLFDPRSVRSPASNMTVRATSCVSSKEKLSISNTSPSSAIVSDNTSKVECSTKTQLSEQDQGMQECEKTTSDEVPLSPMHIPKSVNTARKRSARNKKIESKIKVFDSPTPRDVSSIRKLLLSPQEVRELVRSSTTNHRLDQILYRYEHLSEEESNQRKRLAAKISAKQRRRRLGTNTANNSARKLAWEQARALFAGGEESNGNATAPTTNSLLYGNIGEEDGNLEMNTVVFDEVRAVQYDFSDFSPPSFQKTAEQRKLILDIVERHFVFAEFRKYGEARTNGALDALIKAFEPMTLSVAQILLHQGIQEGNDSLYILENGVMDVQKDGVSIGNVSRVGDCFGELSLMYHAPSNVTISVALSSSVQGSQEGGRLLKINQKVYRGLLHTYLKLAAQQKRVALKSVSFLYDVLDGDDTLVNRLSSVMVREEFVCEQAFDATGDSTFFIIHSGKMNVVTKDGASQKTLEAGNTFGDRALIESLPRSDMETSETKLVACSDIGVFFSIDRDAMEKILGRGRLQKLKDMRKLAATALVKKVKLSKVFQDKMANRIVERKFGGEEGNTWRVEKSEKPALYVVREGPVVVSYNDVVTGEEHRNEVAIGDVFGHQQLQAVTINGETKFQRVGGLVSKATNGRRASIGVLPLDEVGLEKRESGKHSRPPIPLSPKGTTGPTKMASTPTSTSRKNSPRKLLLDSPALQLRSKIREAIQTRVSLDDLEKIRLLGEGQYGEVWMVATDVFQTGVPELRQTFALKSQLLQDITRGKNAVTDIMKEVQVLKEIDHPQVVDLVNVYRDEASIHILMGLIPGGELWDLIHTEDEQGNWKSGLSEDNAKFFSLVLADTLDFIHEAGIVYRDLKPENIMIDADGYPVLVDFGFAKHVPDKTYTFVGTPNYVAPEIITNAGHNRCVDYWALGITVYEMITGENPFFCDGMDQVSLYHAICNEKHYPLPEDRTKELINFVDLLLKKNPVNRLGMLAGGVRDLFKHPWLEGLDVSKIRTKQWLAPCRKLQDDHDDGTEQSLLQKMGIPCLDTDDSNEASDRDENLVEDYETSIHSESVPEIGDGEDECNVFGSDVDDDEAERIQSSSKGKRKKKAKKKGFSGSPSKSTASKKMADPSSEFKFVTPTEITYFQIQNPSKSRARRAKDKEESKSRRSALKGALQQFGIDSDDSEDELQKILGRD